MSGLGAFCSFVKLNKPLNREDSLFTYTDFNFKDDQPITIGMGAMIDDEFVRVETVGELSFTVKRGCADTIPADHLNGALCWMVSDSVGTDQREYAAGQTIGVKVSPFTTGGGTLDIATVDPIPLTFNWRFFRPYPPAQMKVNNARWHVGAAVSAAQPNMLLSWVHRDRVLQANVLLGQDDATIGPEPGTTYGFAVHRPNGDVLRMEVGLRGMQFNYQWPQIVHDFGYPAGVQDGYVTFTAQRDGLDSWQYYTIPFSVDPAGTLTSQYMQFDSAMLEVPYRQNLLNGLPPEGNFVAGIAARPSDRMSDKVDFITQANGDVHNVTDYCPWVTSDYRLPELETTLNIRSSSFYDGVALPQAYAGKLGLIDNEFVLVEAILESTVIIRRGCLDTIPAVHLPGARMWLVEVAGGTIDATPRQNDTSVEAQFRPVVYGPEVPLDQIPKTYQYIFNRSTRPYPPGQVVINGRPWFEEATPVNGAPIAISWARRNRITQGTEVWDHTLEDTEPEVGQQTRLVWYYTTPPAAPGQPDVVHVLRDVPLNGTIYNYTYDQALIDGMAAGLAMGICGTVVVELLITSLRGDVPSWQGYHATLRLPSYPCAG